MNKTLLIARTEIRTTLGRKTFLLFAFGLPLLAAIIVLALIVVNRDQGLPGMNELIAEVGEVKSEGYVDPAGLIQSLPENVPGDWLRPFEDRQAAQQALEAGEIDGYYIIAEDYVTSGQLHYVKLTFDPFSEANTRALEWILLHNLAGGDQALASSLWQPLDLTVTSLAPVEEETSENSWIVELMPTIMTLILYMVIIITASILINAVSDEKKNRVMEIVLSSASPNQFITGKILSGGILGLLMILAWLGVLWMVINFGGSSLSIPVDFTLPVNLVVWAIIYAFLGYVMYGTLMAGVGALTPDVKDARGMSLIVLSPLIVGYMFNAFIQLNPDGPLAVASSLFPLTAPVTMIIRMTTTDVPLWQAVLAAVLMVATAAIIVRLVARLFRAQILLSGQPPSVKRYYRAMFDRA